ncbi:hypothetical protein [Mangrovimonas xylaniphaga]|nr:hypothetical protein [Mangrovimonas xylaniphaga]
MSPLDFSGDDTGPEDTVALDLLTSFVEEHVMTMKADITGSSLR